MSRKIYTVQNSVLRDHISKLLDTILTLKIEEISPILVLI